MANLKDLIVNGVARVIGKVYAPEFVGKLTGNADTATKLGTTTVGSASQPIYLNSGAPTAIGYTIETSVPKNALFTDHTYNLVGAQNTTGLVKNGSSVTSVSDYTACPIVSGIPYYKDTNTTSVSANTTGTGNAVTSVTASGSTITVTKGATFLTEHQNISGKEDKSNKVKSWSATVTDDHYPSEKLVKDALDAFGTIAYKSTTDYLASTGGTVTGVTSFTDSTASTSTTTGAVKISGGLGVVGDIYAGAVHNAVWNDLADCIPVDDECKVEPGYCYCFDGEKYYKSTKYLDEGIIGIDSDTYGMNMGSKSSLNQMDVAVAGFVLAYVDKEYKPGTPLTCTENGYLTEIKKEDKMEYPERIVATYWKSEPADEWGSESRKVRVNGRKWVKVV